MKFLFGFKHKRKVGGAIAFFLAWIVISFLLVFILGYLISQGKSPEEAQKYGMILGKVVGVGLPSLLAFLILRAKGLFKNTLSVVIGLATVAVAFFGGLILALIPVAFLTTREPGKK